MLVGLKKTQHEEESHRPPGCQVALTTALGCAEGTAWGTMRPAWGFRVAKAKKTEKEDIFEQLQ